MDLSSGNMLEYANDGVDTAQTDAAIERAEVLRAESGALYRAREVLPELRKKHGL